MGIVGGRARREKAKGRLLIVLSVHNLHVCPGLLCFHYNGVLLGHRSCVCPRQESQLVPLLALDAPAICSCPQGVVFMVSICQQEVINMQTDFLLSFDSANFPKPRRCDWLAQCRTENAGGHTSKLKSRDWGFCPIAGLIGPDTVLELLDGHFSHKTSLGTSCSVLPSTHDRGSTFANTSREKLRWKLLFCLTLSLPPSSSPED